MLTNVWSAPHTYYPHEDCLQFLSLLAPYRISHTGVDVFSYLYMMLEIACHVCWAFFFFNERGVGGGGARRTDRTRGLGLGWGVGGESRMARNLLGLAISFNV